MKSSQTLFLTANLLTRLFFHTTNFLKLKEKVKSKRTYCKYFWDDILFKREKETIYK